MGKIMYLGDEYSSDGTTVIPNPEGEATDDLNTIQIGEDIFNVVGSGGGGESVVALPSLYSAQEKMVGLWTDNKPLYQKTFHIDSFTSTSWYSIDSNFTPDLYSIKTINSNGYVVNGGGYTNQRYTLIQTNGFWIRISQNNQGLQACIDGTPDSGVTRGNCDITVQYTKTADTPVEDFNLQDFGIFAPVIYSLEEREIGVWTDGKPLYEKTLSFTATKNTGSGSQTYEHNIPNVEYIWVEPSKSGLNMPRPANNSMSIGVTVDATYFYVESGVDRRTVVITVTVRYTKTTDVAGSGNYAELGVPAVHYDDTERVIGTWFGETLYRKTFSISGGVACASNTWVNTEIPVPVSISKVIHSIASANSACNASIIASCDNTTIYIMNLRNASVTIVDFTIEYTKTTT